MKETFGDMLQRVIRTAITLKEMNMTPEDVISLCTINHINSAIAWLGVVFAGCKVASIDPTFSIDDIVRNLEIVKPKLVFVSTEEVYKMEQALLKANLSTKIVVLGETETHIPFLYFLRSSIHEENYLPTPCKDIKETAVIAFSSGTTAAPKGICLSHFALICQCSDIEYAKTNM